MPAPENVRLAVLIDADNTSPKHAEALLEEVAKYGVPTVKRAYGDWTNTHLSGWMKKVPKYAVQPMLQVANTTGQELHRLGADHRRDGPALLRQRRRLRAGLQRQRLHLAGDPAARLRA